jgi:Lon protease-like protein
MSEPEPTDPTELPIFELPLALVPGERVPLHIFEPRYRRMIGHSLDSGMPFGIVLRDDEGARTVGCTAFVAEVLQRHEDGRMDIVAKGGEPFAVLDRFEASEWPAAHTTPREIGGEAAQEQLGAARAAFAELLEAVGAEPARAEEAAGAFEIAAQVEMPAAEKQVLLEAADETARLEALEGSLRSLLGGVRKSRELAENARTNGHGPPPRLRP